MNNNKLGVVSMGIKLPILREGDDLVKIIMENIEGIDFHDKDVLGITESVVARTKGEYIEVDMIAANVIEKFGKDATICLVNPIYSRNRFAMILKGIARAAKKVIIVMPEYDEVGNPRCVNPFTGVNIEEYYKKLCEDENCECVTEYPAEDKWLIMSNHWTRNEWLDWIYCGLHDYNKWGRHPYSQHVTCYTLADICSDKSPDWGVLGTNKATEERLKLFPSKAECQRVCEEVKAKIKEKTGKDVIVCVYGDGCFKDPVGGIWEFADPVTMPGYTDKELIESTPNELKLKYLIDEGSKDIEGIVKLNKESKKFSLKNSMASQGTTPRLYRDLLASLMDLTSGSGDRATPVVLIQNYF